MHTFTLGWPPSVNHYWQSRRNGRGRYIGPAGVAFLEGTMIACKMQHVPRQTSGRVGLAIVVHPPNNIDRDLDNLSKATLDSLVKAGVLLGDSRKHLAYLSWEWGDNVPGGKLVIRCWRHFAKRTPTKES